MRLFKRGQESQEMGERQKERDDKFLANLASDREDLGIALVEAGFIDEEQLHEAFQAALRQRKRLRQVLIERKLVTPTDVLQVLLPSSLSVKEEDEFIADELVAAPIESGQLISVEPPAIEEAKPETPKVEVKSEAAVKRFTSTFMAVADNAPQVTKDVTLTVTPPFSTSLVIEETLSPEVISGDEPTEVTYTVTIKNAKQAVARNVTFDWRHLPEWFRMSGIRLDGRVVAGAADSSAPLEIGDIAPGESKSIVIFGTAFPT